MKIELTKNGNNEVVFGLCFGFTKNETALLGTRVAMKYLAFLSNKNNSNPDKGTLDPYTIPGFYVDVLGLVDSNQQIPIVIKSLKGIEDSFYSNPLVSSMIQSGHELYDIAKEFLKHMEEMEAELLLKIAQDEDSRD